MKMPKRPQHTNDYIAEIRKPPERKGFRDTGPDTKGGEYHGGPKRWTGRGPPPARHIPWPELFKHHISLVEGHLKMIDMVRKHTLEGSGNWHMICSFIDRARAMLADTKQAARTFVPPPKQREQVALGSSSASMYPGYSPADHIYGEAAEEFGRYVAEKRARGEEIQLPDGVEYEVAQSKGIKRKIMEQVRRASRGQDGIAATGANSTQDKRDGPATDQESTQAKNRAPATNGHSGADAAPSTPTGHDDKPLFVIDTQPMKLDLPDMQAGASKSKKAKTKHEGDLPTGGETEDISAEVDAKLKEKREKKKDHKEGKKRKRDSAEPEKPKKKKHKHHSTEQLLKQGVTNGNGNEYHEPTPEVKMNNAGPLEDSTAAKGEASSSKKRSMSNDASAKSEGKKKKKKKRK